MVLLLILFGIMLFMINFLKKVGFCKLEIKEINIKIILIIMNNNIDICNVL